METIFDFLALFPWLQEPQTKIDDLQLRRISRAFQWCVYDCCGTTRSSGVQSKCTFSARSTCKLDMQLGTYIELRATHDYIQLTKLTFGEQHLSLVTQLSYLNLQKIHQLNTF